MVIWHGQAHLRRGPAGRWTVGRAWNCKRPRRGLVHPQAKTSPEWMGQVAKERPNQRPSFGCMTSTSRWVLIASSCPARVSRGPASGPGSAAIGVVMPGSRHARRPRDQNHSGQARVRLGWQGKRGSAYVFPLPIWPGGTRRARLHRWPGGSRQVIPYPSHSGRDGKAGRYSQGGRCFRLLIYLEERGGGLCARPDGPRLVGPKATRTAVPRSVGRGQCAGPAPMPTCHRWGAVWPMFPSKPGS